MINVTSIQKFYIFQDPRKTMENILVSDVMTRSLVTSNMNSNLLDCAKKIVRKKVGGVLIVDGKKLKGFISSQDILWALIKNPKADLSKVEALDISPKKIITIRPSASISEAIEKIKRFKFYRLPVVEKGEVLGMITIRDILSFYPGAQSELKELELIREEEEKLNRIKDESSEEGICEECGNLGELKEINGLMICANCSRA